MVENKALDELSKEDIEQQALQTAYQFAPVAPVETIKDPFTSSADEKRNVIDTAVSIINRKISGDSKAFIKQYTQEQIVNNTVKTEIEKTLKLMKLARDVEDVKEEFKASEAKWANSFACDISQSEADKPMILMDPGQNIYFVKPKYPLDAQQMRATTPAGITELTGKFNDGLEIARKLGFPELRPVVLKGQETDSLVLVPKEKLQ